MALIEQTFVDRIAEAEASLVELAKYADRLTSRLVGYADETGVDGYAEAPGNGILPDVGNAASRMLRKVNDIQSCLRRIEASLPAEVIANISSGTKSRVFD